MSDAHHLRPVTWVGTAHSDLLRLSKAVQRKVGFALFAAQQGIKHIDAKPLRGFGSAGVLEIVANVDGDTFRGVYTVRFAESVYVLHVFQKKSKSGIATSERDIKLIRTRLATAEEFHKTWQSSHAGAQ